MVIKRERRKVNHQKKERERTADDIPKHCATARLRKISGRTREREQLMIFPSIASPQDLENHQKEERDRGEQLIIFISIAAPQYP